MRKLILLMVATLSLCANAATRDVSIDNTINLPDIGDFDRNNLTIKEANLLGLQVIGSLQYDMLDDYDTITYLNNLGNLLVSYSSMSNQTFNFYLMKDNIINAFALPGGYICINNGLIYATLSEAELASVLAHEISHITQHHIYRNISIYKRSQLMAIAGLLSAGVLAAINPAAAILAITSGQGIATQNILTFSRDFENEADRIGQQTLYNAGFDAHAMPEFFAKLNKQEQFNNNNALAFLRTHPVTSDRLSEAENRANQLPIKMREDSIDFLLIREKARVRKIGSTNAITYYKNAIQNKKYTSLDAQYYGLAFAYFTQKKYQQGLDYTAKIKTAKFQNNPIILSLQANLLTYSKQYKKAEQLLIEALNNYPDYKSLWMGQINLYFITKNYHKLQDDLETLIIKHHNDLNVWDKYSLLYSDAYLNDQLRYHYGIATQYYLWNNFKEAMAQYQLALASKSKSDKSIEAIISAKILEIQDKIPKSSD